MSPPNPRAKLGDGEPVKLSWAQTTTFTSYWYDGNLTGAEAFLEHILAAKTMLNEVRAFMRGMVVMRFDEMGTISFTTVIVSC